MFLKNFLKFKIGFKSKSAYRDNVCIIVKNRSNKFLVVKDVKGYWGFVQGGVSRKDKDRVCAAFRELKEEVGLSEKDVKFIGLSKVKNRYDWPKSFNRDGYRGQKQVFCLLELKKAKKLVLGKKELKDYLWVDKDELKFFFKYDWRNHLKCVEKMSKEFPDFFK